MMNNSTELNFETQVIWYLGLKYDIPTGNNFKFKHNFSKQIIYLQNILNRYT